MVSKLAFVLLHDFVFKTYYLSTVKKVFDKQNIILDQGSFPQARFLLDKESFPQAKIFH